MLTSRNLIQTIQEVDHINMHPLEIPTILKVSLFALLGLFATCATAQDFCALTVHVTDGISGRPGTTWIHLEDASGKVVLRESKSGATWRICDFGFGPHVLRVGTNGCLPVAISNIRLVMDSPLELHVVLDSCGYREKMRNACMVYFRMVTDDGKPIAGATFAPSLTLEPPKFDSYGRYQELFKGSHDLAFTAPGFESTTAHIECQETEEVDHLVVMHPRR